MSFFSIIIPTYNRADILKSAIQSVLNQKFNDWELIIVDDGSTDHTKEVIGSFDSAQMKYVYQENSERGAARNKGVLEASGKYVFFLDSDDLIYPDHLQHAFEELKGLDFPAFFHIRYEEQFEEKKIQVKKLDSSTIKDEIERQNQFACQFFLRKDVALEHPFTTNRDLKIGEDWEVILKIAARYPLHFSNKVLSAIVQHADRSMQVANSDVILKSRDILIKNLAKDEMITENIKKNVFQELTSLAALASSIQNNKKEAYKLWRESNASLSNRRSLAIFKKILFGGKS